jgi:hypothetical protein
MWTSPRISTVMEYSRVQKWQHGMRYRLKEKKKNRDKGTMPAPVWNRHIFKCVRVCNGSCAGLHDTQTHTHTHTHTRSSIYLFWKTNKVSQLNNKYLQISYCFINKLVLFILFRPISFRVAEYSYNNIVLSGFVICCSFKLHSLFNVTFGSIKGLRNSKSRRSSPSLAKQPLEKVLLWECQRGCLSNSEEFSREPQDCLSEAPWWFPSSTPYLLAYDTFKGLASSKLRPNVHVLLMESSASYT